MTEDAPPPYVATPETPQPERPKERATRPYIVRVWGQTFAIEGADKDNVTAHLVRKLRRDVRLEVADFEDGIECANAGIVLERAGATDDLFPGAGDAP